MTSIFIFANIKKRNLSVLSIYSRSVSKKTKNSTHTTDTAIYKPLFFQKPQSQEQHTITFIY